MIEFFTETGSGKTKMEIVKSAVGSVVGKQESDKKEDKQPERKAEPAEETHVSRSKKVTPKKLVLKSDSKDELKKDE